METTPVTRRLIIDVAPVEQLAEAVARLGLQAPVVMGLPPGGLLTASRVARALQVPLDMLLPRHADAPTGTAPDIAWPALAGRSAVIVDDGNADPLDWHAAFSSLRRLQPDCVAVVVPALSPAIEAALANEYEHLFGWPALDQSQPPGCASARRPAAQFLDFEWRGGADGRPCRRLAGSASGSRGV